MIRLAAVREWLLPAEAERDEGFRQEILSLSYRGIRIAGGVEIATGALGLLGLMDWVVALGILLAGVLTVLVARMPNTYVHSRSLATLSFVWSAALAGHQIGRGPSEDYAVAATAIMTLASVAVPLLPWQGFAIGAAAVATGVSGPHPGFVILMTIAATLITATLYAQRRANYQSYIGVIQASQELQSRLLAAESSNTLVRMSAALAHELSSPIGTASSAIDTLMLVSRRMADAESEDRRKLAALQADLGGSLKDSMARLKRMVHRIQRLTSLDEAATRSANVNELVKEALNLVEPDIPAAVRIERELGTVPEITCRPQQLIEVFSNVISNSVQAVEVEGRITVTTRTHEARIEIVIEDNGRGIAPEKLAHIFDPAFQAADGRISTGNWSLFISRQFVKEHGGEMRIDSRPGAGTTVSVLLPC